MPNVPQDQDPSTRGKDQSSIVGDIGSPPDEELSEILQERPEWKLSEGVKMVEEK